MRERCHTRQPKIRRWRIQTEAGGYGEGCSVDEIPGISGVLNDGEKTNEDVGRCGAQVEDQDVVTSFEFSKVDSEIRARYGSGMIFEADDFALGGKDVVGQAFSCAAWLKEREFLVVCFWYRERSGDVDWRTHDITLLQIWSHAGAEYLTRATEETRILAKICRYDQQENPAMCSVIKIAHNINQIRVSD